MTVILTKGVLSYYYYYYYVTHYTRNMMPVPLKSTTEGTPSATVTPTQSRSTTFAISMDVVRRDLVTEPRTKSWHRSKPFSVANIKHTGLCKGCTQGL